MHTRVATTSTHSLLNVTSSVVTRKIAPALAAGCTVIIKPSEETPLSAMALCAIAEEAGVPPG